MNSVAGFRAELCEEISKPLEKVLTKEVRMQLVYLFYIIMIILLLFFVFKIIPLLCNYFKSKIKEDEEVREIIRNFRNCVNQTLGSKSP